MKRAACLLLALCACGKERPDPRLAEITTPVHATVRVIDAPIERTCTGSFVDQFVCLTLRAERRGCVYLEVGTAADTPERNKQPDPERCHQMTVTGNRATLVTLPARKATLFVDPAGERLVIDLVDSMHAAWLRKGQLVVSRKLWDGPTMRPSGLVRPDGTLNWFLIPPYLAVLDERLLAELTEAELDALLATTPDGKRALRQSLSEVLSSSRVVGDDWSLALSKLDEADRALLRKHLLESLASGDVGPLPWFLARPEEQTADFISALEQGLTSPAADTTPELLALLKLAPKRAEVIACGMLEKVWHINHAAGYDAYDPVPPDATALAVIITLESKCPWVMPLLEQRTCAWELRCDPDLDDHRETPLCTAAQSAQAIKRTLDADSMEWTDDDDAQLDSDWGRLLIPAAQVQGPLPASFKRSNERRQYALEYTFKGFEADDSCRQLSEEPQEWACRLPTSINVSTTESCRLVVDDTMKTLTVTPVPESP